MKKETLEKRLKQALQEIPAEISDTHFEDTISLGRKEACLRQTRKRISFMRFLYEQVLFTGRKLWMVQGIFLLLIHGMFSRFGSHYSSPQTMLKLLSCLSILVFMSVLPVLYRSVRYQMQEIEAASRFSCIKLLLARLIIIGLGDVLLLGGIFLTTIIRTALPAGSTFLYLYFPSLLTCSGCLYMLGHFTPDRFLLGSFLFCFALILVCSALPGQYTLLFHPSFSAVVIILCVLLSAFCAYQFRYIIKISSYEEMQLI